MLKIEHTEVYGWEAAIRGMRNPKNSWDKSDSYATYIEDPQTMERAQYQYFIGEADKRLMLNLAAAGSVHAKYRRMIVVAFDVIAPMYLLKELDTYKVSTVCNSCSTMHKLHSRPLELDDFSIDDFYMDDCGLDLKDTFINVVADCEMLRKKFLETGDKRFWKGLIQLLPSSYNQRRTMMMNYEVLAAIYRDRKNHKLNEWHTFCDWIESLPHSDIIIGEVSE